jgi:hypothetical protein
VELLCGTREEGKEKRIAEHHNIEIHHCAGRGYKDMD